MSQDNYKQITAEKQKSSFVSEMTDMELIS